MARSACCPAITLSGQAGASALKIVSATVIGTVIQVRTGAGLVALTTRPGGKMIFNGRNEPSLIGNSNGVVRNLKATSQAERPAVAPELYGPATCGLTLLRSTVNSSAFTSTRILIGIGLPILTPSSSMNDSAAYVPFGICSTAARASFSLWSKIRLMLFLNVWTP